MLSAWWRYCSYMILARLTLATSLYLHKTGWEERKAAELKALERICDLAPKKTGDFLLGLWKEFDAGETDEARFARAIDRSMPVLLNLNRRGGSWRENGVSYERVVERAGREIESG